MSDSEFFKNLFKDIVNVSEKDEDEFFKDFKWNRYFDIENEERLFKKWKMNYRKTQDNIMYFIPEMAINSGEYSENKFTLVFDISIYKKSNYIMSLMKKGRIEQL